MVNHMIKNLYVISGIKMIEEQKVLVLIWRRLHKLVLIIMMVGVDLVVEVQVEVGKMRTTLVEQFKHLVRSNSV